ncbi:PPOX class F420-dependent oxidoreductase [Actinokineospora auranticolor]|uniref:PPOX class probable F420-dependent enzyme n=1 Tax=Actinokineospora auranticolor TaxID=155976 RepID=A0A2S6GZQ9_9PSEU|nr:PPOX class F420-dependent oxidoreductase [Actinokineospora auranticolor]PPK70640.1 PPOX class probable F420-dependent enzyme [Actinokineospora auranticolor]
MAATLSDAARALFDGPNFAVLSTINADGSPQSSVLWVTRDGDDILLSTLVGRKKERNLRRDPRVSLTIYAADNPYAYAEVRGTAELTTEGGGELIHTLARKYTGEDYKADAPGAERVVVRITPTRVTGRAI